MTRILSYLPIVLAAAVLLGVVGVKRYLAEPPADAEPYLARCRQQAAELPLMFDRWIGEDVPVPTQAVDMLKPNVLISRTFATLDGDRVALLIVQSGDARQLMGHYPPNCYPGQGWQLQEGRPLDVEAAGIDVDGTHYTFLAPLPDGETRPVEIYNFMLRPTGETGRDLSTIDAARQDGRRRYMGAGQFQLLFHTPLSDAERGAIFESFLDMSGPLLREILTGSESI